MEQYPGNSNRDKQEPRPPKKIEKIVEGRVVRRKKSLGERFSESFVGNDIQSVMGYVMFEVLIPAAKDTLADAISQGIERMLFGDNGRVRRNTYNRPGHTSYTSYSARYSPRTSPGRRDEPRNYHRPTRSSFEIDDIILATRAEGEEVLDRMFDVVANYEMVTVADLKEMVGVTIEHTDNKWGWIDLRGARVVRLPNGDYMLKLPRPEPLKD